MNLERYSDAFCYAGDPNVAIYAHMRVCTSFCIGMNPGTDLKPQTIFRIAWLREGFNFRHRCVLLHLHCHIVSCALRMIGRKPTDSDELRELVGVGCWSVK